MQTEYDIIQAFKRIEDELTRSMIRNFDKHRAEELAEGYAWDQWQAVQLRELDRYMKAMPEKYIPEFEELNDETVELFERTAENAEKSLVKRLNIMGLAAVNDDTFFKINNSKLTALIEATISDFTRAEHSIFRRANDQYRKIIFDAQIYAGTGATYEHAVDMATKDFLRAGINSIEYKNGSRHTLPDYTRMAIRTGNKRAYLMGEGNARDVYGIHTVKVNSRTDACPKCSMWLNRVLVDDVYSGGTVAESMQYGVPMLSYAISQGFLHPNCKDVYSTYIPGISRPAKEWTREEMAEITDRYNLDQEIDHAEDMKATYDRMAELSLDAGNKETYRARARGWAERLDELEAKR